MTRCAHMRPCPWCGKPPEIVLLPVFGLYHVSCANERCPVRPEAASRKTKRGARAVWNRRRG